MVPTVHIVIEARQGRYKAMLLDVQSDPLKLTYILDRLVEFESEWSDLHPDPQSRRITAAAYIAESLLPDPRTRILEVWHVDEEFPAASLVGLIGFTKIVPTVNAEFHPIFFDGKLRNGMGKRELMLRALDWAFETWALHRVSAEVPWFAAGFVKFLQGKLGFRFEAEERSIMIERVVPHGLQKTRKRVTVEPSRREAEFGSRRYQAFRKHGRWHDVMLLSVTREEFAAFLREELCRTSSPAPTPSKPSPATSAG